MIKRILAVMPRHMTFGRAATPGRSTEDWLDAYYASERDEEAHPRRDTEHRRIPARHRD